MIKEKNLHFTVICTNIHQISFCQRLKMMKPRHVIPLCFRIQYQLRALKVCSLSVLPFTTNCEACDWSMLLMQVILLVSLVRICLLFKPLLRPSSTVLCANILCVPHHSSLNLDRVRKGGAFILKFKVDLFFLDFV